MFEVNWEYTCYECECPLNVKLVITSNLLNVFFRDYGSWAYLKSFCLCHNTVYYKFYGLCVKRVCVTCFHCPKRPNLVDREHGIKRIRTDRREYWIQSKSREQIYEYFSEFAAFRNRRDLEICIVDEWKRKEVCGLKLFWKPLVT